jgi:hemerythrin-like metal-binding protein
MYSVEKIVNEQRYGEDFTNFEWSKAIETGHLEIDQEHRKIVDYLNELRQSIKTGSTDKVVSSILVKLQNYIDTHFSYEEEIMNSFDYKERDTHLAAHAGFIRRISLIKEKHLESAETAQALMLFAYDWLIKHITSIDRIMIKKFLGDTSISEKPDEEKEQASKVIDGAYSTIAEIEELKAKMADPITPEESIELQNKLTEASSRLINLVTLASYHVAHGDDAGGNRERLNSLRSGLVSSSRILLESRATKLVKYCSQFMLHTSGIPYGGDRLVKTQMNRILELIDVLGGMSFLSPEQQALMAKAATLSDAVLDMVAQNSKMIDFDKGSDSSHQFKEAIAKRAASQSAVLNMVKRRNTPES